MKKTLQKDLELYLIEKQQAHYRYVYNIIKHQEDSLDVIQESIFKALKKCHQLKDKDKMNAWFYRILMTTSYDYLRKHKNHQVLLPEITDRYLEPHFDHYADIDLSNALASLSAKEQTVIHFRYYEDMKIEDIAIILNENTNTVKTRIYSTLQKLRTLLKHDFKEVKQ